MTKFDTIKSWPIERFIEWMIMIERKASTAFEELNGMSDEELAADWYDFLTGKDDDENNPRLSKL